MSPRVILHNVVSLDGRLDVPQPDIGLYYELERVRQLRWRGKPSPGPLLGRA